MSVRRLLVLAILLAPLIAYLAPLARTHADQDTCSFGPVSNREYLELLQRAKQVYAASPRGYAWSNKETEQLLKTLHEKIVAPKHLIYERIAGVHALLRALGAEYRGTPAGTAYGTADPYVLTAYGVGFVHIQYILDVNRFGPISPYPRYAGIAATLAGPREGSPLRRMDPLKQGEFRFAVNNPNIISGPTPIGTWPPKGNCPLMPGADIDGRFSIEKE